MERQSLICQLIDDGIHIGKIAVPSRRTQPASE